MTTANDARKAHKILDDLFKGNMVLDEEREFLRRALPELPKQKTLEEITAHVYDAWLASSDYEFNGNEYDPDVTVEDWLLELHKQLKELKDATAAAPVRLASPEFLETEADYAAAPEGTIVVGSNYYPWTKAGGSWLAYGAQPRNDFGMRACRRYVLRWGDK